MVLVANDQKLTKDVYSVIGAVLPYVYVDSLTLLNWGFKVHLVQKVGTESYSSDLKCQDGFKGPQNQQLIYILMDVMHYSLFFEIQ